MKEAVVLFAHGSREPQWAQPFEALRAQLAARCDVEVAFLELMSPTLDEAVARLVARGAPRVRVVPMFLGHGGHLKRDLPVLAQAIRARHPGLELVLAPTIGEQAEVISALATLIARG